MNHTGNSGTQEERPGNSLVVCAQKKEQVNRVICRLEELQRMMFLWQLGLEYLRSDGSEDFAAVLKLLTEQLKILQEQLEHLEM